MGIASSGFVEILFEGLCVLRVNEHLAVVLIAGVFSSENRQVLEVDEQVFGS